MATTLQAPVVRYLNELEHSAKRKAGVVPEDVLSDAREHLERDARALTRVDPKLTQLQIYQHFLDTYGQPDEVAQQYEDSAKPILIRLPGYAPGWRICCTRCGRSAPAEKAGITRVGAISRHKYVIGWCRDCRWLRWLRIEQDLDASDLTRELGANRTAAELRAKKHHPWIVVSLILTSVLVLIPLVTSAVWAIAAMAANQTGDSTFDKMPDGWQVSSTLRLPGEQARALGQKFGGQVDSVTNTVIRDGRRQLQINIIVCRTNKDADAVRKSLLKVKQTPGHVCRRGEKIFEFMCRTPEQARFAEEAKYRLPILPKAVKYRVHFDAAPISACEPMAWNKLFNLLLRWESGGERQQVESEIAEMSKRFQFDRQITLKSTAQGDVPTVWNLDPPPVSSEISAAGDATRYVFTKLPTRAGVPFVHVDATLTSTALATTRAKREEATATGLTASTFWPVDDPQIVMLARKITLTARTDQQKADALLAWFADRQNIRPGGETGSRYGAIQVLQQRFGNCWDYSDLFVTLCRASGLAARQIFGWLHNGEGHVWSEVLIDHRWQQLDSTTGLGCGSNYIPLVVSEDGKMPFVYASKISIEVLEERN